MDFAGENHPTINVDRNCSSCPPTNVASFPDFLVSLQEFRQFKATFSDCLHRLEALISRFKTVIVQYSGSPSTDEMSRGSTTSVSASTVSNSMDKPITMAAAAAATVATTNNVDDLRTVLADIDHHLILLKEMEERNEKICESFAKEIRTRDEALVEKLHQINAMSHEMAQLQARINQLLFRNTQLETEMKYLKTGSSFTNTETSSTPVKGQQAPLPPQPVAIQSKLQLAAAAAAVAATTVGWSDQELPHVATETGTGGFNTPTNNPKTSSVYHDLLVQYKKIEQLIDKNSIAMTQQQQQQQLQQQQQVPTIIGEEVTENTPLLTTEPDTAVMATPVLQEEPPEVAPLSTDKSPVILEDGDHQQPTPAPATEMLDNEDVVATSIKAYEHFVKMQHDLEVLMKKENEYRARIAELERENQRLSQESKENEFQLSNVQYELDILKHNYELEIESFSTAINEREALIEKLQQKMQNLKARYQKLDERRRSANEQILSLHARIEELEGRLKYEELQKETLIDVRISELETRMAEQEHEYQTELTNLKTDLACKESIEMELRAKIDELELSLKNLASPEFEDEFVYYKNQIDSLVKELDKERQERQRAEEQFEQAIRAKDRLVEQTREQAKKEKDAMMREKTDYEQRYRKMVTKLKCKETELKQLQEKMMLLTRGGGIQKDTGSPNIEQLLAESALKEIKMNELTAKIEDCEDRLKKMADELRDERERRRRLETCYLNAVRNQTEYRQDHIENYQQQQQQQLSNYRRDSMSFMSSVASDSPSLALLMDTVGRDDGTADWLTPENHHHHHHQQSLTTATRRWLRRQQNILMFGQTKAKLVRLAIAGYLVLLHYLAFFRRSPSDSSATNSVDTEEIMLF